MNRKYCVGQMFFVVLALKRRYCIIRFVVCNSILFFKLFNMKNYELYHLLITIWWKKNFWYTPSMLKNYLVFSHWKFIDLNLVLMTLSGCCNFLIKVLIFKMLLFQVILTIKIVKNGLTFLYKCLRIMWWGFKGNPLLLYLSIMKRQIYF